MQDINRGKLAALLTAVEQGSTLTKSTICTITREILESEFYEEPDADWPMPEENGTPAPESGKEPSDQSDRSDRSDRSDEHPSTVRGHLFRAGSRKCIMMRYSVSGSASRLWSSR